MSFGMRRRDWIIVATITAALGVLIFFVLEVPIDIFCCLH